MCLALSMQNASLSHFVWSIFTFLWGRDLDATFSGKPGLCQGNIKMVGQNRMLLKTFWFHLSFLEAVFMLLHAK